MKRRTAISAIALVFTAVVATTIVRCDYSAFAITSYSFIPRERPRVFISHHPLRAMPGQPVTIRLAPDLRSEDGMAQSAVARIGVAGSNDRQRPACSAEGSGFVCTYTLPESAADYVYDGDLVLANGATIHSRSYRFRAATNIGPTERITLREPVAPNDTLAETYRVNTVFVRDEGDQYQENVFLSDIENATYTGILADPVYRWRDSQLAFYQHGSTGITSSYYSGFNTRCGQNPWPDEAALRSGFGGMDVMAVLHRHPNTAGGVEGAVTATTVFRDCAGTAVRGTNLKTLSAVGSLPLVAKHEFGHAAFGLGDEYTESESTRRVNAATPMSDEACCCMPPDDGVGTGVGGSGAGVTGGGAGLSPRTPQVPRCVGAGRTPNRFGLQTCSDQFPLPVTCAATPESGCPSLLGDCVRDLMWLGQTVTAATTLRPNVFTSQTECEAGRTAALGHPGVENPNESAEAMCRPLCGGSLPPCPCGPAEAWIVDKSPNASSEANGAGTDTMGTVLAARHGATCAWCVDTSLCVRWERARGRTADEAWAMCEAPPLDSAERERGWAAWMRAIAAYIDELTRDWGF